VKTNKQLRNLKIWTVGHSTRELADFLHLLEENNIEAIADVRSLPGSRKFPQFNSEDLEPALREAGMDYKLIKQLGGRRKVRPDSPHTVWRHKSFRGYADYMDTPGFEEGIEILIELAREKRTAIMCAEAVWWRCHRSMIADHLKARGAIVEHIMDGKNVLHPYTSAARFENGRLYYGAG
jgi:uncharacterized protein (DUF488 family)